MNTNLIKPYLDEFFKHFPIRKTILNAIYFFLSCALRAKTLVPTKVGQQTQTAYARNGVKRVQRFLKNRFFTTIIIEEMYCHFFRTLTAREESIILAVASRTLLCKVLAVPNWTIIREKFCFFSISLVLNQGRSIPVFFTGYIKKELGDDSQSIIEQKAICKILDSISKKVKVTILADRGWSRLRRCSPGILDLIPLNCLNY